MKNASVLHLTLKKKWFDMIASGEKVEEYREIKPYWTKRLNKDFELVQFRNGYGHDKPMMVFVIEGIDIGRGNPDHGADPDNDVYRIKLGRLVKSADVLVNLVGRGGNHE